MLHYFDMFSERAFIIEILSLTQLMTPSKFTVDSEAVTFLNKWMKDKCTASIIERYKRYQRNSSANEGLWNANFLQSQKGEGSFKGVNIISSFFFFYFYLMVEWDNLCLEKNWPACVKKKIQGIWKFSANTKKKKI